MSPFDPREIRDFDESTDQVSLKGIQKESKIKTLKTHKQKTKTPMPLARMLLVIIFCLCRDNRQEEREDCDA